MFYKHKLLNTLFRSYNKNMKHCETNMNIVILIMIVSLS